MYFKMVVYFLINLSTTSPVRLSRILTPLPSLCYQQIIGILRNLQVSRGFHTKHMAPPLTNDRMMLR